MFLLNSQSIKLFLSKPQKVVLGKIPNSKFQIPNSQKGVTLLLAILILSSVVAISFSLATIMFIEVRDSGDLLKTEPAIYAATGIGEQAFFNLERHACTGNGANCYTANFSNNVTLATTTILSTSNPIFADKVKTGASFSNKQNEYDFCGGTATSSGCQYGKVTVNYTTGSDPLYAYLCQFDPTASYPSAPCSTENTASSTQGYWLAPTSDSGACPGGSQTSQLSDGSSQLTSNINCVTWTIDHNLQQELILTNPSGGGDIYVQIKTFGSDGVTPKGLPYIGNTVVGINTQNASVGRKIQVVVPNSSLSNNSAPLAYWKLDESAGATTFADSSGNGDTGSCSGSGSFSCPTMGASGEVGTAASFVATQNAGTCITGNYINLAHSLLNQKSQWTWAGWVYLAAGTNDEFYTEGNPQVTFLIRELNGAVNVGMWNINRSGGNWVILSSTGTLTNNAWNHIAITLENGGVGTGTLKFYINGALDSTAVGQMEDNASASYAVMGDNVGAYGGGGQPHLCFNGELDDVRIYDHALSDSEIAALASSGSITVSPNCNSAGNGTFNACYYNGMALTNLLLNRTDSYPLNFDWGNGSPDPLVPVDQFSASWVGSFNFTGGSYTFTMISDDGSRLYIDGTQVINAWFDQAPNTYTYTTSLSGNHTIRMEYYENGGGAVAKLSWSGG